MVPETITFLSTKFHGMKFNIKLPECEIFRKIPRFCLWKCLETFHNATGEIDVE